MITPTDIPGGCDILFAIIWNTISKALQSVLVYLSYPFGFDVNKRLYCHMS